VKSIHDFHSLKGARNNMDIAPSLRPLFQGGYAIVDAHQMRHSAWGSPEGVALIDSAGCAARSRPTWRTQPPCHPLTLLCVRAFQPPLSRRTGPQGPARAGASDQVVQASHLARAPLPERLSRIWHRPGAVAQCQIHT
jgi:hypothetical protein